MVTINTDTGDRVRDAAPAADAGAAAAPVAGTGGDAPSGRVNVDTSSYYRFHTTTVL